MHEPGTRAFVTELRGLHFAAAGGTVAIEICRDGAWEHPRWGRIEVSPAVRQSFAANFAANVRRVGELPVDFDHEAGPAAGWIAGLRSVGASLFADVRLTPAGRERVERGEYRFFSPEWHPDWQDPETGARHGPTLFGGALTNRPFFRGLAAVCCAEPALERKEAEMAETERPEGAIEGQEPLAERLAAVEAENAALRLAEERRAVTETLVGLRFREGSTARVLAPAGRGALAAALLALSPGQREPLLAALRGLQLVETGERGFAAAEEDEALSAGEEQALGAMAVRHSLPLEALRRQFLAVRARRP